MGLQGGRVVCTGAKETPACRPPDKEESSGKPLVGATVVCTIVEMFALSWFPCPWGTLLDANFGGASEASEGLFAVVNIRMLPTIYTGEGALPLLHDFLC